LVHFSILRESNNKDTFAEFVRQLIGKIKGEAVVYMDNYSVHYSKKVKDFFDDSKPRVIQRFLPSYSCTLNPIERLWLVIKEKWKRAMIQNIEGLEDDECVEILQQLLDGERENCKKLASCHVRFLIKSLNDEFV